MASRLARLVPGALAAVAACNPDQSLFTHNSAPEATIDSHVDGDGGPEGYPLPFRGTVSDRESRADTLFATWLLDGFEVCSTTAPEASGLTTCDIVLDDGEGLVTLEVRDSSGAQGDAEVVVVGQPTDAPIVELISPDPTLQAFYADHAITFSAIVTDAEDDPDHLVLTWESDRDGVLDLPGNPDASGEVIGALQLGEGEHLITLTAEDLTGKTTTVSTVLVVRPANNAPSCSLVAPLEGAIAPLGSSLVFRGEVADPDVPATWLNVSWASDKDGPLGSSTPGSDGTVVFPWNGLTVNAHAVTMTVADDIGVTCSDTSIVTVGTAPLVSIAAPQVNRTFPMGSAVVFAATVLDNEDPATALDLEWTSSVDGLLSATRADPGGQSTFVRDDLSNGWHDLTLTVTDTLGLVSTDTVRFKVNLPPTAPVVEISPADADTTDDLVASPLVPSTDPDGDAVSLSYKWYRNGSLSAAHTAGSVPAADTRRDEVWRVVVTPTDGFAPGEPAEATITIRNSMPVVASATIVGGPHTEASTLQCEEGTIQDADGDPVDLVYGWTVDGVVVGATTGSITGAAFGRDDVVRCTIVGDDGQDVGPPAVSAPVTIANTPPAASNVAISPSAPQYFTPLTCTYTFSDIDQDPDQSTRRWYVNGVDVGSGGALSAGYGIDDEVTCTVTPKDGSASGTPVSASVWVVPSAPTITGVTVTPGSPNAASTLTCQVQGFSDPQGDSDQSRYVWKRGTTTLGTAKTLTGGFARGDTLTCTATPSDGAHDGTAAATDVVIGNFAPTAPSISLTPAVAVAGGDDLVCAITSPATDVDSDVLTYQFTWTVDGVPYASAINSGTSSRVTGLDLFEDEAWACVARAYDGRDLGATATKSALIVSPIEPTILAGGRHTCLLGATGSVSCWGANSLQQATAPSGNFRKLSSGMFHNCGVNALTQVVSCWGDYRYGQTTAPTGTFLDVSAGHQHTCAIKTDRTVVCWGVNTYGQSDAPGGTFDQVSAGNRHTCGLRDNGQIVCWGDSSGGRLVPPTGTYVDVDTSFDHTCAINDVGGVACWGVNTSNDTVPPALGSAAVDVAAGVSHTCAALANGTVKCWGSSTDGKTTPPASGTWWQVDAGEFHSCAYGASGYQCWGDNTRGQLAPP